MRSAADHRCSSDVLRSTVLGGYRHTGRYLPRYGRYLDDSEGQKFSLLLTFPTRKVLFNFDTLAKQWQESNEGRCEGSVKEAKDPMRPKHSGGLVPRGMLMCTVIPHDDDPGFKHLKSVFFAPYGKGRKGAICFRGGNYHFQT
jgi:hypothetical protein